MGEGLSAAPVGPERAARMVQGWLKWDPKPMQAELSGQIGEIHTFADPAGESVYYVVDLEPTGYVIVPAEDEAEPVIAFVEQGRFNPSPANPMGALIGRDLPNRIAITRRMAKIPPPPASEEPMDIRGQARNRWTELEARVELPEPPDTTDNTGLIEPPKTSSISDVRIAPLVQSKWNQMAVSGKTCFNYYTPNNYPSGCVATAVAQLMRYYSFPTTGIGVQMNKIKVIVNGTAETRTVGTLGGDGLGGPYSWDLMPLIPSSSLTTAQRQAIGALCYDAGVVVGMEYSVDGSSATLSDASRELRESFGFSQSVYGRNGWPFSNTNLDFAILRKMINPNLDAGFPTLLAILDSGDDYGHAIVCDGYGFQGDTAYHHLNMGWSGTDDAWYALPTIDGYLGAYDTVYGCVYNTFTSGRGEIISGRTVDSMGQPISGVIVSTNTNNGPIVSITNNKGIYALPRLESNRTYTIAASKIGWSFVSKSGQTRTSVNQSNTCGNLWNLLLVGQLSAGALTLNKAAYTAGDTIQIDLLDNDLNNGGAQSVLVQTSAGDQETVVLTEVTAGKGYYRGTLPTRQRPFTIGNGTLDVWQGQTITVIYQDLNYGNGQPAAVTATATVKGVEEIVYATDFEMGLDSVWTIMNGGNSTDTWEWIDTTDEHGQGKVMLADSDAAGNVKMDEQLILRLDCTDWNTIRLHFEHYFKEFSVDPPEIGDVDYSINDGAWKNLVRYQYGSFEGKVTLNLPGTADGQPNVRIRWRYYNANWDYHWLIDNVQVTGLRGHRPPTVDPLSFFLTLRKTQTITLSGTDDGYPCKRLQYWITTLPRHGSLSDPDMGIITADQLPYALSEGKKQIVYSPRPCFVGEDRFSYSANDFDLTTDGGMSEPAEVFLTHPVILNADFEAGLPKDWTILDGYSDGNTWAWTESGQEGMMIADSDAAGEVFMDESLISPVIDCRAFNQIRLVFDHNFIFFSDEIADVDIRINGGAWHNLIRYQEQDKFEIASLDVSTLAAGQSVVQFRWRYYNAYYDLFWAIFRVTVLAGHAAAGDFEEDCDIDLTNFADLAAAWKSQNGQESFDPACDIAEPFGSIDLADLTLFCQNWMIHLP